MMPGDKQEHIRKRAYELWDAEGRIDGYQEDHWRRAEAEVETAGRHPPDITTRDTALDKPADTKPSL